MISNHLSDYAFEFPKELIATRSPGKGKTKILHCPKDGKGPLEIVPAPKIVEYFRPGDCIVVNNTKVIPARLFGRTEHGGEVEILLVQALFPGASRQGVSGGARTGNRRNQNDGRTNQSGWCENLAV